MTEQQQYPTREQVVRLLTLLADGRAEYFHGKEPQHQGDLRAMRFDELIIYAEREAARHIRDIVAGDNDGRGWMPSWRWDDLDAVLALFPQPTPSAETCGRKAWPHEEYQDEDDACVCLLPRDHDGLHQRGAGCGVEFAGGMPSAEPPSIADMAPGTTFTAVPLRSDDGFTPRRWMITRAGWSAASDHHDHLQLVDIDPSTIRDVTPSAISALNGSDET